MSSLALVLGYFIQSLCSNINHRNEKHEHCCILWAL